MANFYWNIAASYDDGVIVVINDKDKEKVLNQLGRLQSTHGKVIEIRVELKIEEGI